MSKGKQTCKILKDIRRQIAEANDIKYITSECQYKGDCAGTCPKCEAEVRYLEQQLESRRTAGKAVALAGISAGLLAMSPLATAQEVQPIDTVIAQGAKAYENDTTEVEETVMFGIVEQMPEFPHGGVAGFMHYLKTNTRYPDPELSIEGRVTVQFCIEKDGSICDVKVLRGIHPLFDEEALRVINSMPQWKPGMVRGRAIKMKYTVPIMFTPISQDSILIKGVVEDKQGAPIATASILEKGTTNGTISNASGHFELNVSGNHPLVVQFVGMETQEIEIDKQEATFIRIILHDDEILMGEVPTEYQ